LIDMPSRIQMPKVPDAERSPLVDQLLVLIERLIQDNLRQAEAIQQLRDEIAVLKGEKGKPKFKASGMDRETDRGADCSPKDGAPGREEP